MRKTPGQYLPDAPPYALVGRFTPSGDSDPRMQTALIEGSEVLQVLEIGTGGGCPIRAAHRIPGGLEIVRNPHRVAKLVAHDLLTRTGLPDLSFLGKYSPRPAQIPELDAIEKERVEAIESMIKAIEERVNSVTTMNRRPPPN